MFTKDRVILMADDSSSDCNLVAMALKRLKFLGTLKTVPDGAALLAALRGEIHPSLILLDLNMPVMDGFETLHEIKCDPLLCSIPIVIWSTSEHSNDILRTYRLGTNAFVAKPDSFDKVLEAMRLLTHFWFKEAKLPPLGPLLA